VRQEVRVCSALQRQAYYRKWLGSVFVCKTRRIISCRQNGELVAQMVGLIDMCTSEAVEHLSFICPRSQLGFCTRR
jgi:hypothetical protein